MQSLVLKLFHFKKGPKNFIFYLEKSISSILGNWCNELSLKRCIKIFLKISNNFRNSWLDMNQILSNRKQLVKNLISIKNMRVF